MCHAYDQSSVPDELLESADAYDCLTDRYGYAAKIRALRDWLVPFEEVQGPYVNGPLGWVINTEEQHRCDERQRLRALLTAEAERAEKGDA
jgi:hypothetical protein